MPKGNLTMNFSAYGLLFALGIAISAIVAILICKKRNIERYEIVYSGVFTMAGAVIGAKLFFSARFDKADNRNKAGYSRPDKRRVCFLRRACRRNGGTFHLCKKI